MSILNGLSSLIVEDEATIALELAQALQEVGALVTTTTTLKHALALVVHDDLAIAILDHAWATTTARGCVKG